MTATLSIPTFSYPFVKRTRTRMSEHRPVMLQEILSALELKPGAIIVDGTIGLGGHSREILKAISPSGKLIGFDWDARMLDVAAENLRENYGNQISFVNQDYREIPAEMEKLGIAPNGIVLDLGLNSAQIDDPSRGIAFMHEGPLDMRMDASRGEPASSFLNRATNRQIEDVLFNLGDERWARAIAATIVERRKTNPLRTTTDLVEAVLATIPPKARDRRIHPATRTFQAIRIAINGELEGLQEAIEEAAKTLAPAGIIAVLSYHSGEDRAVKNAFRNLASEGAFEVKTSKPVTPSVPEIARNSRARSAKMRILQKY